MDNCILALGVAVSKWGFDMVPTFDDLMKLMDRFPIWKRLQGIPLEVDELKRSVAALEGKLNGKWPADVCRFCGERTARLTAQHGPRDGAMIENWFCSACSQNDRRMMKAK